MTLPWDTLLAKHYDTQSSSQKIFLGIFVSSTTIYNDSLTNIYYPILLTNYYQVLHKKKSHIFISLITFQTHIGIDEVLNSKSPNIWLDFGIYIRFYFTACGSTDQMLEPSWHCWNFESQIWFPNLKVKAKQKSISYTAREREMVEVLNNNAIHHYWWSCWSKWQWSSWFIVQCIKIHHNFNGR